MKINTYPTKAVIEQDDNRILRVSLYLKGENITLSPYNTTVRLTTEETTGEPQPLRDIVRGGELRCQISNDWEFGDKVNFEIVEDGGERIVKDLTDAVKILDPDSTNDELRAVVASLLVEEK